MWVTTNTVSTLGQPEMFLQNKPGLFDGNGGIAADDTRQFLQKAALGPPARN